MKKYGLQRGVDGSEARHVSTQQYYRDIKRQTEELKTEVVELQERKKRHGKELEQGEKEIQTERLKGAATTAARQHRRECRFSFREQQVKTLEGENTALHGEVATHEKPSKHCKPRYRPYGQYNRQVLEMQQRHDGNTDEEAEHKRGIGSFHTP